MRSSLLLIPVFAGLMAMPAGAGDTSIKISPSLLPGGGNTTPMDYEAENRTNQTLIDQGLKSPPDTDSRSDPDYDSRGCGYSSNCVTGAQ